MGNNLFGPLSTQQPLDVYSSMTGVPGLAGSNRTPTSDNPLMMQTGPTLNPALFNNPDLLMQLGLGGQQESSAPEESEDWWNDPELRQYLLAGLGGLAGGAASWRQGKQMGAERALARGVSDAAAQRWNAPPVRRAEGGLTRYFEGGTKGQDDQIPALLSDGEYVMDADTVAALGDGNNKAGAAALDQMRANLRTHKRKAPANKIPPKAKKPEAYLKGAKK